MKDISTKQKVILLCVAGVGSLVGLVGLSQTTEDYYVTAAISRAIFISIGMFVLLSPVYFYYPPKDEAQKTRLIHIRDHALLAGIGLIMFLIIVWVGLLE